MLIGAAFREKLRSYDRAVNEADSCLLCFPVLVFIHDLFLLFPLQTVSLLSAVSQRHMRGDG